MTNLDPVAAAPVNRVKVKVAEQLVPLSTTSATEAARLIATEQPSGWNVVITPNLYHLRLLSKSPELRSAYARAALLLPDGWPVALVASWRAGRWVRRAAGSDLLETLVAQESICKPLVFVGGNSSSILHRVLTRASAAGWKATGHLAPSEEIAEPLTRNALISRIAREGSGGVVVLGLGAPKQERFAQEVAQQPGHGWILCVGMSINFSGDGQRRAPRWMQRLRLEWAYRIAREPRRMIPRYLRDLASLPGFVLNNLGRQT